MKLFNAAHEKFAFKNRTRRIAELLSELLPEGAMVLDVGCGDGLIDELLLSTRPDLKILGVDTLLRDKSHIEVTKFDGITLPFENGEFEWVQCIDVLHHANNPQNLFMELARVASKGVVIKDHVANSCFDTKILQMMDWAGNAKHGVALPYNFLSGDEWQTLFDAGGFSIERKVEKLKLYPPLLDLFFGRKLHFIAKLEKCSRKT
ncbi:MAG: SAM-dependent methyltransferase [Deltaproteobacteria bacterium]|nr:MAG: SAM-dependent methyltransferase [Deltaproteobacteria bacterium]